MKTLLRVKTIALTAIICFLASSNATAKSKNDLRGTWKAIVPIEQQDRATNFVFYKIFKKDNTFINLTSNNGGKTFSITSKGSYSIEMPGIYVEGLTPHFANKYRVSNNVITYERDGNTLKITFTVNGRLYNETWILISK